MDNVCNNNVVKLHYFLWLLPVLIIGYVVWALNRPLPTLKPVDIKSFAAAKESTPELVWSNTGIQAVGVNGFGVMATHGTQQTLPTASVAKVMVAMAVLQKKPLALDEQGPKVPITANDVAFYKQALVTDQSHVAVQEGEIISEYQALQALLLPSANNFASTLTNWAFGSLADYVAFANNYAKSLGMTQTVFSDASGFLPTTVSTPSDLVLLGQAALQNPIIRQIVAQPSATIPVAGLVHNYNSVLGDVIDGIKTGNTDQAGGVFLFSGDFEGTPIVGATMGEPNLEIALRGAAPLITSVKNSLKLDKIIRSKMQIARYDLPWGGKVTALAQNDISIIDWKTTQLSPKVTVNSIQAGAAKEQQVGSISLNYHGKKYSSNVILSGNVAKPSIWWRLTHPFSK